MGRLIDFQRGRGDRLIMSIAPQFKWTESTVFVGHGRCCLENDERMVEYQILEVGV
jgi:hypothetical protein